MKRKSYKKYLNSTIATAIVATSVVGTTTGASAATEFPDVKEIDFFYEAVKIFSERGAITGFPDGTFKPYEDVSRGQMAVILANILKLDTTNVEDPGFTDVPKTHPYYGAIAALYKAGYISGHIDKSFKPYEPLSRYHTSLILSKAFKFKAKNPNALPFTDVHVNYKEFVAALYELGITVGISDTIFGGTENLSRGQFVQFLLKVEEARKKIDNQNNNTPPGNNNPPIDNTPPPDRVAPIISVINNLVLPGQKLSVTSNEMGALYVTTLSTKPTSVTQLKENNLLNSPVPTANMNQEFSLDDLPAGTYYLYVVDNAGNISDAIQLFTDPEAYILEKINELSMYTYGKKESELDGDFIQISDDDKALEILKRTYVILMAMINYGDLSSIGMPMPVRTLQSEFISIETLQSIEPLSLEGSNLEVRGINIEMLAEKLFKVLMGIEFINFIEFNLFNFVSPQIQSSLNIELPTNENPTLFSAEAIEEEILTPQLYAARLDSTLKVLYGLVKFVNEENTELKQFDSEVVGLINYAMPYLYLYLIDTQFNPNSGIPDSYFGVNMLLKDMSLENIELYYGPNFNFDKETQRQIVESIKTYVYNEELVTLMVNRVFKNPSSNSDELELINSIDDILNLKALLDELGIDVSQIGDLETIKADFSLFIEMFTQYHVTLTYLLNVSHYPNVEQLFNKAIDLMREKYPEIDYAYISLGKVEGENNQFKIVPHYFNPTFRDGTSPNLIGTDFDVSLKVDDTSSFSYSLWNISSKEDGDNITVTESQDGIITIQVEDSDNNGSLNGFYELEIYDEVNEWYYYVSFVVSNEHSSDGSAEVISLFASEFDGYVAIDTNAIDGDSTFVWEEEYNPNVWWEIDPAAGLLGYSYLVLLYDSSTDHLHWVVKDIPRFTNGIEEGIAGKAGEVVVEYQVPNLENGEPGNHEMLMEVYLLNTSSIDFTGVDTSSYKAIINKIRDKVVAYGYYNSTFEIPNLNTNLETTTPEKIIIELPEGNQSPTNSSNPSIEEQAEDDKEQPVGEGNTTEPDSKVGEEVPVGDGGTPETIMESEVAPDAEQSESGTPAEENENTESPPTDTVSYKAKDTIDFGLNFVVVNGIVKIV